MKGTINGTLPDPAETQEIPVVAPKTGFWGRRKTLTYRAIAGLTFAAVMGGGLLYKASADDKVSDLQAQIAAMQDADSTGAGVQGSVSGTVTVGTLKGQSKVTHPKALSPGQNKYKCVRQDVG